MEDGNSMGKAIDWKKLKIFKILLTGVLVLAGIVAFAQNPVDTTRLFYENGNLKAKGVLINGKEEGLWLKYYPDEKINAKEQYRDGLLWGKCIYFYPNGNKMQEENWDNGGQIGEAKYYFESGKLKRAGSYGEGGYEGPWLMYHENGLLRQKGNYKQGKPFGPWKFFSEKAVLIRIDDYPPDWENPDSEFYRKYYFPSGAMMMEGNMKNGKETGTWILYKKNGKEKSRVDY
jgi:antitoxin component YwqK of YwqJK toxin-antitoxin module